MPLIWHLTINLGYDTVLDWYLKGEIKMGKFNVNGSAARGTAISDFSAADTFVFNGSSNGNNGLCVRIKDTKSGKNRFMNVENGKILTASAGDVGTPVDADVDYSAA